MFAKFKIINEKRDILVNLAQVAKVSASIYFNIQFQGNMNCLVLQFANGSHVQIDCSLETFERQLFNLKLLG